MSLIRSKIAIPRRLPLLVSVVAMLLALSATARTSVHSLQFIKTNNNKNNRKKPGMKATHHHAPDQQHALHQQRPPDELGRFYNVEPEWKGTSYSYVRPSLPKKEDTTGDSNTKSSEDCWETLEFPHCGSVTLENHAERVAPGGKEGTGFALWSAALAISSYLDTKFATDAGATEKSNNDDTSSTCTNTWRTSLELGAGLGLPSIVLARHGVQRVVATDKDPAVVELLEKNMRDNLEAKFFDEQKDQDEHPYVTIETLDWANPNQELAQTLAPDVIVASDIIWNATQPVWEDLLSLLGQMRENYHRRYSNQNRDPWVILGYTQRRLDMTLEEEQQFFRLLDSVGMEARTLADANYSDHWPLTVLMELRWKDAIILDSNNRRRE